MKKYLAYCSFIGRNYSGFQSRTADIFSIDTEDPLVKKSVQEALELALSKFTNNRIVLNSSSRTDAGVNAYRMPCCFVLDRTNKTELSNETLRKALNYHLSFAKEEISVVDVKEVPMDFNPKKNVVQKEYIYRVEGNLGEVSHYVQQKRKLAWSVEEYLDIEKLRDTAQLLVGTHNFKHFTSCSPRLNDGLKFGTTRTIDDIKLNTYEPEFKHLRDIQAYELRFFAKGFMQYQIRYMANAIVAVASGKSRFEEVKRLLEEPDSIETVKISSILRRRAPSYGLFLNEVKYEL